MRKFRKEAIEFYGNGAWKSRCPRDGTVSDDLPDNLPVLEFLSPEVRLPKVMTRSIKLSNLAKLVREDSRFRMCRVN